MLGLAVNALSTGVKQRPNGMATEPNASRLRDTDGRYHRSMATTSRIGQPARIGHWGLTVDKMTNPTEWIVLRYPEESKRHTDRHEIVRRVPYAGDPEGEAAQFAESGMATGTAMSLVFQVEAKRASPKAADADLGYRPVS
jgi:hypothetical protein